MGSSEAENHFIQIMDLILRGQMQIHPILRYCNALLGHNALQWLEKVGQFLVI